MARTEFIDPRLICGGDLVPWLVVEVQCVFCPAGRVLDHAVLQTPERRHVPLSQIKFKCRMCKTVGSHEDKAVILRIVKLPRNY